VVSNLNSFFENLILWKILFYIPVYTVFAYTKQAPQQKMLLRLKQNAAAPDCECDSARIGSGFNDMVDQDLGLKIRN
jgi:hypothetical protein